MADEIIITAEQLEPLRKLGLINETHLRNLQIKRDFRRMKKEGITHKVEKLAEKYNLAEITINCILYDSRYNQNQEQIYVKELV